MAIEKQEDLSVLIFKLKIARKIIKFSTSGIANLFVLAYSLYAFLLK